MAERSLGGRRLCYPHQPRRWRDLYSYPNPRDLRIVENLSRGRRIPLVCLKRGLSNSSDSGLSFATVPTVTTAYNVGFGNAKPGRNEPSVFLYGVVEGVTGIFRSVDGGANWTTISDPQNQFSYIDVIIGDPRVYGRVYLGSNGRGILYGDIE